MYPYGRAARHHRAVPRRHRARRSLLEAILSRPAQFSVWAIDGQYRYLYFNQTHAALMREFWGTDIRLGDSVLSYLTDPSYRRTTRDRYSAAMHGEAVADETGLTDRSGAYRTFHTLLSPLGRSEVLRSAGGIAAFSIETTQLRQQQLALRAAEEDKESLLHELDHRVKNNLQTILSILNIQVNSLSESTAREVLQDAMMRVAALGHLYDASVVTEHVSQIALHIYLGRIVQQNSAARGPDGSAQFSADMEEMYVPMATAVPLGLVTAELLAGFRKHTELYPGGPGLRVGLTAAGHTGGRLSVTCPSTTKGVLTTFTEEVVQALADQIGATVTRTGQTDRGEQVRVDVLFPYVGTGAHPDEEVTNV